MIGSIAFATDTLALAAISTIDHDLMILGIGNDDGAIFANGNPTDIAEIIEVNGMICDDFVGGTGGSASRTTTATATG